MATHALTTLVCLPHVSIAIPPPLEETPSTPRAAAVFGSGRVTAGYRGALDFVTGHITILTGAHGTWSILPNTSILPVPTVRTLGTAPSGGHSGMLTLRVRGTIERVAYNAPTATPAGLAGVCGVTDLRPLTVHLTEVQAFFTLGTAGALRRDRVGAGDGRTVYCLTRHHVVLAEAIFTGTDAPPVPFDTQAAIFVCALFALHPLSRLSIVPPWFTCVPTPIDATHSDREAGTGLSRTFVCHTCDRWLPQWAARV